jgi:hypothetical protein
MVSPSHPHEDRCQPSSARSEPGVWAVIISENGGLPALIALKKQPTAATLLTRRAGIEQA